MKKRKLLKITVAFCLVTAILLTCMISVSAQTPKPYAEKTQRTVKDIYSSQIVRGTSYNLEALSLYALPKYMGDSLGFSYLSADKQPKSVTDINVEDLYSFTTLNNDGTLTLYMFSEPVKYVDTNTLAIRFIDNTIKLKESVAEDTPIASGSISALDNAVYNAKSYTNTANFFTVDMPASVNRGITLSYDDVKFSLTPMTASLSTAELKTSRFLGMTEQVVEYRNALGDGVHLQYIPLNNGVKENIVLDRYTGTNEFKFIFDAGDYYPVYTEGEAIPFVDPATDQIALILGQADARDSYTGEATDGHFTLYNSLKVTSLGNGKYALTVIIDKEFLADPDTVYPVVIDPSYTIPSTSFYDTSVYSGKPYEQTFYSSSYMIVGNHGTGYGEGIAFIQTNNIANYSFIDPDMVSYASYRVYEGSGKTNYATIRLYGTNATWSHNTITYSNKPDYDNGTITSQVVDHSGWYAFDCTRHIRDFLAWARGGSGRSQAYGFALAAVDSTASSKHFCSGEYTGSAKPSIIINYTASSYNTEAIYNSNGSYPFKAFGKMINGASPLIRFRVATAGTYIIETLSSSGFGAAAQTTDTMIELFDQNHNRIAFNNDNLLASTTYSRISASLSPGVYYVLVSDAGDSDGAYGTTDSIGLMDNVKCYLIIEKQGELQVVQDNNGYQDLADLAYEAYKTKNASNNYMCYGYAIGNENTRLVPVGTIQHVFSYLQEAGYANYSTSAPSGISKYVVGYGSQYNIHHYSKVENGVISAKHGNGIVARLHQIDAYFPNSQYGSPVVYFW